ncbi:helix-turn-helix transcriptional regulator [Paenibacillus glycanilyticus]|uniref:helix-turn-helix transcriptional regulator n=1 Tax=Paenibacillus glycanilyticus TaxID=126569 RepID=UPI00203B3DE6|nr:helix-turn-helix transcriptional regulator [Paenibacillus glycanilyticus]MCM3629575.1 helix-turn-helix transcriptional regulator [Paenibacillus glycanilyticus]
MMAEELISGIQYGFEWETTGYIERKIFYNGQPVIYYQFTTDASERMIRVVPDGCVDLLFCCDPAQPTARVCGTVLQGKELFFKPNTVYFGVRLSARLSLLLPDLPLKEVIEVQAPFEESLTKYKDMGTLIAERPRFSDRIACFEKSCMPILAGDVRSIQIIDYCLTSMQRSNGSVTIRDLAEDTGYSERYIRTKFEQSLGISPKLYNRIIRFQRALSGIVRGASSLTDVAMEGGYFDQSHFMKEFKSFSQLTPIQLRKHRNTTS